MWLTSPCPCSDGAVQSIIVTTVFDAPALFVENITPTLGASAPCALQGGEETILCRSFCRSFLFLVVSPDLCHRVFNLRFRGSTVVPSDNARFARTAVNARWGSRKSAQHGDEVIDFADGLLTRSPISCPGLGLQ